MRFTCLKRSCSHWWVRELNISVGKNKPNIKMSYRMCYYAFNGLFMVSHYTDICFMALMNGVISDERRWRVMGNLTFIKYVIRILLGLPASQLIRCIKIKMYSSQNHSKAPIHHPFFRKWNKFTQYHTKSASSKYLLSISIPVLIIMPFFAW